MLPETIPLKSTIMNDSSMAVSCPRCSADTAGSDWCDRCQRRVGPPPVILYEKRSSSRAPRRWRVHRRYLHLTAAVLSLLLPGAGQVYKGRVAAGIAWLLVIVAAYVLVGPPGLLLHLMCVVTAGSAARQMRRPFRAEGIAWPAK
jgi:hypothetical protein